MKSKRYLLCWETWLKIGYITLAVYLPRIVSWETNDSTGPRLVATLALLFSWFEMMFLLSRFPDWGYYFFMFGKVASKVLKVSEATKVLKILLFFQKHPYFYSSFFLADSVIIRLPSIRILSELHDTFPCEASVRRTLERFCSNIGHDDIRI